MAADDTSREALIAARLNAGGPWWLDLTRADVEHLLAKAREAQALRERVSAIASEWESEAPHRVVGQAVAHDLRAALTGHGMVDATLDLRNDLDAAIKRAEAAEAEVERLRERQESAGLANEAIRWKARWRQLMRDHEAACKERDELLRTLTELAPSDEVLVEGSFFQRDDLPRILGNFMRSSDEYATTAKAHAIERDAARAELQGMRDRVLELAADKSRHHHITERRSWGEVTDYSDPLVRVSAIRAAVDPPTTPNAHEGHPHWGPNQERK